MALATFALTEALVENLITPIIAAIGGGGLLLRRHALPALPGPERRLGENAALP
jgi:hypothetical protein